MQACMLYRCYSSTFSHAQILQVTLSSLKH